MSREITFQLPKDSRAPVFLSLARVIAEDIRRGRLVRGARLPGTRTLSRTMGIHRNTVDAAYHELILQGWIVAQAARGHFVADDIPNLLRRQATPKIGRQNSSSKPRDRRLAIGFADGTPDSRLLPAGPLARFFRRSLSSPELMLDGGYGDPRGCRSLREALAEYLAYERAVVTSPDNIMVTRGSQMALHLIAASVLQRGDIVVVENPGYPLAWRAFEAAGLTVIGTPIDSQGIAVDQLAERLKRSPRIRAVYMTPHHQYPTTVTLSAGRRLSLLALARQHGLVLIEDDYDHEYRFEGKPILPMVADSSDILYVCSLSKLLAPGIRLGCLVVPQRLIERCAQARAAVDRQGDVPLEHAVSMMIRSGEMRRHVHRSRRVYHSRREVIARELERRLGKVLRFDTPAGGLALWTRIDDEINGFAWARRALEMGLKVKSGQDFARAGCTTPNAFRLGFGDLTESEIVQRIGLLARAIPRRKELGG